jgi:hypothetical protein
MTLEAYERLLKITQIGNRRFERRKRKIGGKGFRMFMPTIARHIMNCLTEPLLPYRHLLKMKMISH